MSAGTAAKALLKSRCPATPITSAAEAEHPRFVIPTPNGRRILFVRSQLRLLPNTLCTQSSSVSQIPPPRSASE
jgi:hypothetical protein